MENEKICEECKNPFKRFFNKIMYAMDSSRKLIRRSDAYDSATYGNCMTREQFVMHKQIAINRQIREKVYNTSFDDTDYEKYFLLVSLNKVEEECAHEIFKPFSMSGYTITKISDIVEALKGSNVYLIDWRNF